MEEKMKINSDTLTVASVVSYFSLYDSLFVNLATISNRRIYQ